MIINVNESIPNFYSIIPADLRCDKRLNAPEKIFFSEISALTNLYGYCYAGNKYFATLYSCDVRTITRWIKKLETLGYIKVEIVRDENKAIVSRKIYIRDSANMIQNVHRGIDTDVHRGMDKNVLDNNIYINNISHTQNGQNEKIKYADKVSMLSSEYDNLVKELGQVKTDKCIEQLDLYKKSKGVEYASDYDTIKRWVITRVDEMETKNTKKVNIKNIKKKTSYQNYEQREYPEGFFDQFYI